MIMKKIITLISLFFSFHLMLHAKESTQINKNFLNQKERMYLNNLSSPLRIGITQIPNQVLKMNSGYEGFSIDFFKKIEILLNIKFKFIYFETWSDLIDAGKNRSIDILFSAQKTESRLSYYDFTDTILKQKNKIIVSNANLSSLSIKDLYGKKVAAVQGSALYEHLKFAYPKIILIPSHSELHSLLMVSKHMTYATISEAVRASYYMKHHNINNLHNAGNIDYSYNLRIASRSDFFLLNVILSKTVEAIPTEELEALQFKWGYIEEEIDYTLVWQVSIVFFTFVFFILLWIIALKKLNQTLHSKVKIEVEKNRQQQLMMFQQSRLAQMGEMINMIAHQWRQPLSTINGLVLVIDIKVSKENITDKYFLEKELNDIEELTTHMSNTINDFRDFFKPKKERIKFNFQEVIEHALKLINPNLIHEEIIVEKNYQEDIELLGYPNELGQVILNILSNAKDALLLNNINKKKTIHIQLSKKEKSICLSIKDNAAGINHEIIKHIFDPYFSTKSKEHGTGLGLYISKIIIEEHMKGKISVKNAKDGAIFNIEFKTP